MISINIIPEKTDFGPDDVVRGWVEIKADESFKHNEIHLMFQCKERSLFTKQVGKHSHSYSEERLHIDAQQIIREPGITEPGEIRVPFEFDIPISTPSSYEGPCGFIRYTLVAKIERSWAKDLKDELILTVLVPQQADLPKTLSDAIDHDGYPLLEAHLDEDSIYWGNHIRGSFRILQYTKMRGVRVDLVANEQTRASGISETREIDLVSIFFEQEEILMNSWTQFELLTDTSMPASFERELVSVKTFVRVAIDVAWRFDKVIDIPIKGFYQPDTGAFEDDQGGRNKY